MGLAFAGMIGGFGKGLVDESAYQAKQDDANADVERKKDLQGWLMQQQQQYQIATEQRADTRAEASKDRDFTRLQAEAPTRADVAAAAKVTSEKADMDFAAANRDTLAGNTQAQTNAKKTPEERAEAAGKADQAAATAEYYRGAKSDSEAARAAIAKLNPADAAELKSIQDQITEKGKVIDKQKAEPGGWDPAKNPGQASLQTEVASLQLRQRTLLQSTRKGGAAADPLGLRAPAGNDALPKAQPGMIGAFEGNPDDVAMGIANIKDPQERANAQSALEAQLRGTGGTLPTKATVPAQAPAAAPKAAPTGPVGPPTLEQELASTITPPMEQARQTQDREMNDMRRTAYTPEVQQYMTTVKNLRDRIKQQQGDAYRASQFERDRNSARAFAGR